MTIDTKTMVSISDANQNFSKVARLVDELLSKKLSQNEKLNIIEKEYC